MIAFKKLLRTARDKRTQINAAIVIGVPVTTYRNWEQGRNRPTQFCQEMALGKLSVFGQEKKLNPAWVEAGKNNVTWMMSDENPFKEIKVGTKPKKDRLAKGMK